jgi:cyanophycinase
MTASIRYNLPMPGYMLLEGGAEFGGGMALPDRRAMQLAGGRDAPVRIIPAAAAPDHNHIRAGDNGVRWFHSLGARVVLSLPLTDHHSADRPEVVASLRAAKLIYLLGGFPGHLCRSLAGSLAWEACLQAYQDGAVIAGSSAGAMVLCQYFYDPYEKKLLAGLGLLQNACVLPHFNRSGHSWATDLAPQLPGVTLLGIDEGTGMLDDGEGGAWRVYGKGRVTVLQGAERQVYLSGEHFELSFED